MTDSSGNMIVSLSSGSVFPLPTGAATEATIAALSAKFPAAAALADALANATVTGIGAYGLVWNGATWDRAAGNTAGAFAQGNVAHDAVDAGNPVKIGGKANSNAPAAVAAGDRVDAWYILNGQAVVAPLSTSNVADGVATTGFWTQNGGNTGVGAVGTFLSSGSTSWDRQRNNHEVTGLASAARTASVNSSDLTNYNARGVVVTVDITANTSAAGITVVISYKDTLSGKYKALLTSAALGAATATGTTTLMVYPGATAAANVAVAAPLPRVWRVEVTHGDASSITYSIGANYIN